jgi:hypothetical protein
MEPLTMRRMRGAVRLAHDAVDAAVPAIARAHRGIADTPFAILACVGAIAVPVGVVRAVHDTVTEGTYQAVRSTNRALAMLTTRTLDSAAVVFPVARGHDSSSVSR